jgi:hypothetical protein
MGMGGREFSAPNFRTIAVGADEIPGENPELSAQFQQDHKLKHGPGVNWVGRFLRPWRLDKLPQLANVLKRGLTLVNLRMISVSERGEYGKYIEISAVTTDPQSAEMLADEIAHRLILQSPALAEKEREEHCELVEEERTYLLGFIESGKHSARKLSPAWILLLADEGKADSDSRSCKCQYSRSATDPRSVCGRQAGGNPQ